MNSSLFQAHASNDFSSSESRVSTHIRRMKKNSLWLTLHEDADRRLHNFSPALLDELRSVIDSLKAAGGEWTQAGESVEISYLVMRSSDPDYFSVGGDLRFFQTCISEPNELALRNYSTQCLDLLFDWSNMLKDRMTSITLVQGRALGGGFEMALSADYIVAEEQSTFGFPEIMFGLFPCTGAMGLISRRIGAVRAERMMTNNKIYTARELFDMGLIDEICPKGTGESVVESYISQHSARQKSFLKVQQSRMRTAPLDHAECMQIVNDWVELAMGLSDDEARSLKMLIMMQEGGRQLQVDRKAA
jgi:DSF synthase